jgi:hypothetical protein
MPKKNTRRSKKDRYWIVEIDSSAFREFDAVYKVVAPDEKSAKKEALDRFEGRDRRNVVSSMAMLDAANDVMDLNNWGDEAQDDAWEIVTQGWSEPCGDNRWIRGTMYVDEVALDQDFDRWCQENDYIFMRSGQACYYDGAPVRYCPHCDYIRFTQYCYSCGYETVSIDRDFLFDRYMGQEWSD